MLSGDFFQLPPVADIFYGDSGDFCFNSPLLNCFHHWQLTEVHRQSDPKFIQVLHEISMGKLSDDSRVYLSALARPLAPFPALTPLVHLYPTRLEVECHNADSLAEMEGQWIIYDAEDQG